MKISFHGAAREVTGSCHLIQAKGKNILTDCGLFQGGARSNHTSKTSLGFDPSKIDFVVLTHSHLDHIGRIPLIKKHGFKGFVITTPPSKDLGSVVMLDSAHIQEEDAKRDRKKNGFGEPLYTKSDVNESMEHFTISAEYEVPIELSDDIKVTFYDAGHILGSAFVHYEIKEGRKVRNILFSGDLGNNNKPIVRNPAKPPKADIVIMESTYGNRTHKPVDVSVEEFYEMINQTFNNSGNVFIPTLAIERAQELLYYIRQGIEQGLIPKDTKVFLDSPMAIKATEIFKKYPKYFDDEAAKLLKAGVDPFTFPNLEYSLTSDQSKQINDIKQGAIILAGSGMCNGGRILHHLRNNLPRKECSFIFVNYAPQGTLAQRIISGAEKVKMFREEIPVKATIRTIGGFSAHAGQSELLDWHSRTGQPELTLLTHGDPRAMQALAKILDQRGHEVEMPNLYQEYKL